MGTEVIDMLHPAEASSLCGIWATLHDDAIFSVLEEERHYLTSIAVMADQDLVSHLLLKKLRMASAVALKPVERPFVSMNSFVEFTFADVRKQFAQIVHPVADPPPWGTYVDSLVGAGLIGLTAGQSIMWPDANGRLSNLHVHRVENSRDVTTRDQGLRS